MESRNSEEAYFRIRNISALFGDIRLGLGTLDVSDMYVSWCSNAFPVLLIKSVEKDESESETAERPEVALYLKPDQPSSTSAEKKSEVDATKAGSSQAGNNKPVQAGLAEEEKWLLVNTDNYSFQFTTKITFPVMSIEQCKKGFLKTDIPQLILEAINELPFVIRENNGDPALNDEADIDNDVDFHTDDVKLARFMDFVEAREAEIRAAEENGLNDEDDEDEDMEFAAFA